MRLKISLIFQVLIFLIIGTNFSTAISYFSFLFMAVIFVITRKKLLTSVKKWDFIAAYFLFLWLYGIILGFFLKNETSYIIANNAGMTLYFLYFILLQVRFPKLRLYKLILWSSYSIGVITILIFLFNILGVPKEIVNLLGESTGGASTGQQRVYFVSQVTLFGGFSFFLSASICSKYQKIEYFDIRNFKQQIAVFIGFLFFTICIAFLTASKGFMLGFLFLTFFISAALFYKKLSSGIVNVKIFYLIGLIFVFVFSLLSLGYFNIITATFDEEDLGNLARYEQLYFLVNDLTFWGKGLGSTISDYSRNLEKPYGFELSYLSLLHKFGVFGVFGILLYIVTFLKGLRNIVNGKNVKYATVAVGCLGYLLPSIGNPLMFAPQSVLLHCIALFLLREENYE